MSTPQEAHAKPKFQVLTTKINNAVDHEHLLSSVRQLAVPDSKLTVSNNGYSIGIVIGTTRLIVKDQEHTGKVTLPPGAEKMLAAIREFLDAQMVETANTKRELKKEMHQLLGDL